MQAADLPVDLPVTERLLALLDTPAAARLVRITARHEHAVKSVEPDRPLLAVVLRGAKQVRWGERSENFAPGDLLAVAPGTRIDVANRPDPAHGAYLTLGIALSDELLAAARTLWSAPVLTPGSPVMRMPCGALASELAALADALAADDAPRQRLATVALLLELARRGGTQLLLPVPPSVAAQVRQLIAQAPARRWTSAEVERALGLSGATLRRRLAAQGTSLRESIAQARLACALELLYTTRWPLKTVASRVGYRSAASFAQRFRERYGMEASAIGNAEPSGPAIANQRSG